MSVATAPKQDEWVSGNRARQLTGLTWYALHKLALLGKVRALAEPGNTLRFHKQDVQRVARETGRQPAGA